MENSTTFNYQYVSKNNEEVERIRKKYMTSKDADGKKSDLEALKALDERVSRPANIFTYTLGIIGAIIMGMGMSLVMTDIGAVIGLSSAMVPGIVIGVIGMIIALLNYPIYKKILASRKNKHAPEILSISDRIIYNK